MSLVHTIETSQHLPRTYQDYCLKNDIEEHKASRELYESLTVAAPVTKLESFDMCRKIAWFAKTKVTNLVKIVSNSCRLRWCPICAKAKAYSVQKSLEVWIKNIDRPKLLTLTLKHSNSPLRSQTQSLYKFFSDFRRLSTIKRAWRGGVWFYQCKYYPKKKQWHPHLHILLDADFVPQALLSELWRKVTHGSYIVDIRPIRNPEKVCQYVARYVARPCELKDLELSVRQELYFALKGRRMAGSFGSGQGVDLTGKTTPDAEELQKIGTWRTVVECVKYDYRCREIVKCWKSGKPISEDIDISDIDFLAPEPLTVTPAVVQCEPPPSLF